MNFLNIEFIIVQAGGKGTRLEQLTQNKPKALVPVENLPMLFHLFRRFPEKRYIIIADYKKDVLRKYLASFATVKYQVVDADGVGTCSGVRQATRLIPSDEPFMLVWSDLILPDSFELPVNKDNYIGISQTFLCRWSYERGKFAEESSVAHGVAGLFIFEDKSYVADVPDSGELVRWMSEKSQQFEELGLAGTKEFGLISEYLKLDTEKCRPFNKITINGNTIVKEGIDAQGQALGKLECKWYEFAIAKGITSIPKIYELSPLKMERIDGKNIYEYRDLDCSRKIIMLQKLTDALKSLHSVGSIPADSFSLKDAYYNKTMSRLSKIRDLVPYADKKTIIVNGRECRNIYYYKRDLERHLDLLSCERFTFIHGDCTFSNMMLRNDADPVFIDPRGYFGYTELYGDPLYDWAKVYYSIVGNYDRFNLKDFKLALSDGQAIIEIASNGWEDMESSFFELSGANPDAVRLLHAIIWLSLTTYAWQDYDSVCGAFYNGLYYLEEVL